MTCRELSEFLADYVAGDLAAEVSADFAGHLGQCPDCHQFVEQYRATILLCGAAFTESSPPLPEDLVRAILASVKNRDGR